MSVESVVQLSWSRPISAPPRVDRVSLFVLGKGTVASSLLTQLGDNKGRFVERDGLSLEVAGLCDRQNGLFVASPGGVELEQWRNHLGTAPVADPRERRPFLDGLTRLGSRAAVLVDCTAADGMEKVYEQALLRGIHVVTANKKPFSGSLPSFRRLATTARRCRRALRYETTVGASLPVVETLKDLVRTGDRVDLIEGSFSGTLGFLSNELLAGVPFSRALNVARERGYLEPRPQDDLSGVDVARKAVILAREIGLNLGLEDVALTPFVPRELLAVDSTDAFFEAVPAYDAEIARTVKRAQLEGKVLRYLARIDPVNRRIDVGPVAVDVHHPAARLRGAGSFVAFTTERYPEPLVVQGAGAGGALTAAGVLADILAIARKI
ncbi:hypothetical protein LVJ94_36415 [Pendulispora rubella]|uniref:Homoserine dehydrogenase n=1 Tax=Pendulispora rubella TaxID=2741070 RepID=A0ABZ2KV73_9BACT